MIVDLNIALHQLGGLALVQAPERGLNWVKAVRDGAKEVLKLATEEEERLSKAEAEKDIKEDGKPVKPGDVPYSC